MYDADLQQLEAADETAITTFFAEKVGLDATFVQAVIEYKVFRHGYEDSQVPAAALGPPDVETVGHYQTMLFDRLADHFGAAANFECRVRRPSDTEHFAIISIQIGRPAATQPDATIEPLFDVLRTDMGFSPHARIVFDVAASRVAVAKPWTRVAWTVEQAYADARGISEEVLRSGAAG